MPLDPRFDRFGGGNPFGGGVMAPQPPGAMPFSMGRALTQAPTGPTPGMAEPQKGGGSIFGGNPLENAYMLATILSALGSVYGGVQEGRARDKEIEEGRDERERRRKALRDLGRSPGTSSEY